MFSIQHLNRLRKAELEKIASFFHPQARILEIGAGTGEQALELKKRGFEITAIETAHSNYANDRLFPIIEYDGRHIPIPNGSIDVVFSSNVLEHVADLGLMHSEILRVLKPDGFCIHVLPTHGWRFWTSLTSYPDAFVHIFRFLKKQFFHSSRDAEAFRAWYSCMRYVAGRFTFRRHGERGNVVSEMWLFHPRWWRQNFYENGFTVIHDEPIGLFYTGNMLFGPNLNLGMRRHLATVLGSACHLFKIVPTVRRNSNG